MTFIKYTLIASIGTTLDIITLTILVSLLHVEILLATTLAFIVGVIINFNLHKKFTFHDTSTHIKTQFTKFFTVSILNFIVTLISMTILIEYIHCWYLISKIITVTIVLLISFSINSIWTFKKNKKQHHTTLILRLQNKKHYIFFKRLLDKG